MGTNIAADFDAAAARRAQAAGDGQYTVSINVETLPQLRHAMEAIWSAIHTGQKEKAIQPYKMRDYTILVRRGEGGDYGAVAVDND